MRQHWLNKHAIESRVREARFQRWTIICLGHFSQHSMTPVSTVTFPVFVNDWILRVGWKPDIKHLWVGAADVSIVAAAAAVSDPESYTHKEIEFVTEALTVAT